MKFTDMGLSPELLDGIARLKFEQPTPVQATVIPAILKDQRDLVALAQTGTGKTAAFGLPCPTRNGPTCPTRSRRSRLTISSSVITECCCRLARRTAPGIPWKASAVRRPRKGR